jgi:hypothetical protein
VTGSDNQVIDYSFSSWEMRMIAPLIDVSLHGSNIVFCLFSLCPLFKGYGPLFCDVCVYTTHGMFTEIRGDTTRKIVIGGIISGGKARLQT